MAADADVRTILSALQRRAAECEHWDGTEVFLATERDVNGDLILAANSCGLVRLASVILELSTRQPGAHVHFDAASELESCEQGLVITHKVGPGMGNSGQPS
jgi:hypothetical protein